MPSAQTLHQKRHYLIQLSAFVATIFLFSATCAAQAKPGTRMAQQSKDPGVAQDLSAYPGLIPEFGQLFVKLEKNVPYPAPRAGSRLLSLLPESTVFFAAFPNYGDAAHQALQIFRQELQESS